MNDMIFYIICGGGTAAITAILLHPVQKQARADHRSLQLLVTLTIFIPLGTVLLYLGLGRPDIPSQSAIALGDAENKRRQVMLLAEKPVEVIEKTAGSDASALAVMAELNMRLGSLENAGRFLKRAIAAAEKSGDIKLDSYRKRLAEISAQR